MDWAAWVRHTQISREPQNPALVCLGRSLKAHPILHTCSVCSKNGRNGILTGKSPGSSTSSWMSSRCDIALDPSPSACLGPPGDPQTVLSLLFLLLGALPAQPQLTEGSLSTLGVTGICLSFPAFPESISLLNILQSFSWSVQLAKTHLQAGKNWPEFPSGFQGSAVNPSPQGKTQGPALLCLFQPIP